MRNFHRRLYGLGGLLLVLVSGVDAAELKKKLVLTQFEVVAPQQLEDIRNVYDELPQALAKQLATDHALLTIYSPLSVPLEANETQSRVIRQIASSVGAQFVLTGRVLSAAQQTLPRRMGNLWQPVASRELEVEYALYDGYQGMLLTLVRQREQAQGEVLIGRQNGLDSGSVQASDYGQALARLLQASATQIAAQLSSEPFKARIIRREDKRVYLDAGEASHLRVGDTLVVNSRDLSQPVLDLEGNQLGETAKQVDTLSIQEVQPQFAIGKLDEGDASVKVGDWVGQQPQAYQHLVQEREAAHQAQLAREAAEEAARVAAEEARMQQLLQEAEQREQQRLAEEQARLAAARLKAERIAAEKARAAAKARAEAKEAAKKARRASYEEILRARARANSKPSRIEEH